MLLVSGSQLNEMAIKPLCRVLSWADAGIEPSRFTVAPSKAIPLALSRARLGIERVDYFEINEAFAAATIANARSMNLSLDRVNVHGGAVALGHPLGASGSRVLVTLLGVLRRTRGKIGCAAICNGGGGATAMVIESMQ